MNTREAKTAILITIIVFFVFLQADESQRTYADSVSFLAPSATPTKKPTATSTSALTPTPRLDRTPRPTAANNTGGKALPNGPASVKSTSAIALASGDSHSCAITSVGVVCWGNNYSGQLGDGTTTMRLTPVAVIGLTSSIKALTAGYSYTCAITTSGGVKCWGWNGTGTLGDGTTTTRLTPVDVTGLSSGIVSIAGGAEHPCAITTSGGVKCWGSNSNGQLGNGGYGTSLTPVDVSGLTSGVISVSAGREHTCAVTSSGGVKCWGGNYYGELGDGTNVDRRTPVDVVGLTNGIRSISTFTLTTCAINTSGGVKCWGSGPLGDTPDHNDSWTPVDVVGLTSGIKGISAGYDHVCAITAGGGVVCWGDNDYGQIGDGTTTMRWAPVDVVGLTTGITAIDAGGVFTCALTSIGGVKCWGENVYGNLGIGTKDVHRTPVDVVGLALIIESFSISGRIVDGGGNTLSGVTVATVNGSAVTDVGGNYLIPGIPVGTYNVLPSMSGYSFFPTSRRVTVSSNVTGQNFIVYSDAGNLSIAHMEITQGIQDGNNGAPLVANKLTTVRVYVNCGVGCSSQSSVTGILRAYGPSGELAKSPKASDNGSVTAYNQTWQIQRGDPAKTLNFTLPTEWLNGQITLTALVGTAQLSLQPTFIQTRKLTVMYVPIRYKGHDPDPFILDSGYRLAQQLYPMAELNYVPGPGLDFNPFCFSYDCGILALEKAKSEAALYNKLNSMWNIQQQLSAPGAAPDFIFAWFPTGVTQGGSSDPKFLGGANLAAYGDNVSNDGMRTFAHEIGHLLGLHHTNTPQDLIDGNCYATARSIDPASQWPWPNSLIHDWGIDRWGFGWGMLNPNSLKNPNSVYDFMSYCGLLAYNNVWTSEYDTTSLIQGLNSLPSNRPVAKKPTSQTVFISTGIIYTDTTAALDPINVVTSNTTAPSTTGTQYCLESRDSGGNPLASQCFDLSFTDYETGQPKGAAGFTIVSPYMNGTASIALRQGNIVLASRQVSPNAPQVTLSSPNGGESYPATGNLPITWTSGDMDGDPLSFAVLYSADGGSWTTISTGITETQYLANLAYLPGSTNARIRILATDGVNTSSDDSDGPFTVGSKMPSAFIISPPSGAIAAGTTLVLQGSGVSLQDGILNGLALVWSSSKDGVLGTGNTLMINPTPGQHVITLTVTDSNGNTATASVNTTVTNTVNLFFPFVTR